MKERLSYKSMIVKQIEANGDGQIHEQLKVIAKKKGIPLYRFLDIELGKIIEQNKEYLQ